MAKLTGKLTKEQQQKLKAQEKQEKDAKRYLNTMITRGEATSLATGVARQEIGKAWDTMREPMKGNILQTLALYHLLLDKGIIESEEEFNTYLARVAAMVEHKVEDEENGEKGEEVSQEAREEQEGLEKLHKNSVYGKAEETEEQQG